MSISFDEYGKDVSNGLLKYFSPIKYDFINFEEFLLLFVHCKDDSILLFGTNKNNTTEIIELSEQLQVNPGRFNDFMISLCKKQIKSLDDSFWKIFTKEDMFVFQILKGTDYWVKVCSVPIKVTSKKEKFSIWQQNNN